MDIDVGIPAVLSLVHHLSVRENLVRRELHLVFVINLVTENLFQFLVDGVRRETLVFDFRLDVFLLVGLEVILFVGCLLDVAEVYQFVECLVDIASECLKIGIKGRQEQLGDVIGSGWESLDILDEEERFQHLQRQVISQGTFCLLDVALYLGLQYATQSLVHIAELYDVVEVFVGVSLRYLLSDGQEASLTYTLLFSTEGIVL